VVEAWLSSMKRVVRTVFADDDRQHSNPVWVAILWMQVLPMQDRQVDLDESSAPTKGNPPVTMLSAHDCVGRRVGFTTHRGARR
jgi:hypothetical protein